MKKYCRFFVVITLAIIALFVINIIYGAVKIPINSIIDIFSGNDEVNESWEYIILQTRLPQALTAILCG